MGEAAGASDGLVARRHLWRSVEIEVALLGHPLHQIVEQLGELFFGFLVALAAQRLEQLGRELSALDQRVEDRLLERFERPVRVFIEVSPRIEVAAAGKARLQQEVGELSQQRLEIHCIGHLRAEARVGMRPHAE
jgi:hypothetical protein